MTLMRPYIQESTTREHAPALLGLGRPIPPDIIQVNVVQVPTPYLLQPPVQAPGVLGCFRMMGVWPVRVGTWGAIRAGDEMQHRRVAPVMILKLGCEESQNAWRKPLWQAAVEHARKPYSMACVRRVPCQGIARRPRARKTPYTPRSTTPSRRIQVRRK